MIRTPHAQPLPPVVRTTEDGRRLMLLIREPRPEARGAGMLAWDEGRDRTENPHGLMTPEGVSWDAGWWDRHQANT